MKNKVKKLSKKIIFLIVCAAIIGVIALTLLGMQIAFVIADNIECWHPDYDKLDISGVLAKDELTDEDYELLYRQTGLTKIGIDRTLGSYGANRVLEIQDDFFTEHTVINQFYAPFICQDVIENNVRCAALENGDILVTSSTHISGWRIGHAGLVTNAITRDVLQATAVGTKSVIGNVLDFTIRVNFMILSPKADAQTKNSVVEYAKKNLTNKDYNPTTGVFTGKDQIDCTQCAHIVWYAYKQFGIDLDCNGGAVVTPKNIANSPEVELVQVFGFDIDKLWK